MNKINSDFLYFPQALEVWLNFQIDAGAAPSIDIRYTAIWMYCQTKNDFWKKKEKKKKSWSLIIYHHVFAIGLT